MTERIETGPLQIDDDWPGTFIRGDNAFGYAMALETVIAFVENTTAPQSGPWIYLAACESLLRDLRSSKVENAEGPVGLQRIVRADGKIVADIAKHLHTPGCPHQTLVAANCCEENAALSGFEHWRQNRLLVAAIEKVAKEANIVRADVGTSGLDALNLLPDIGLALSATLEREIAASHRVVDMAIEKDAAEAKVRLLQKRLDAVEHAMIEREATAPYDAKALDIVADKLLEKKDVALEKLATIVRNVAAWTRRAMRTRPDYDLRCEDCNAPHNIDTSIPSAAWNAVCENRPGVLGAARLGLKEASVLCTLCIDERLQKAGITDVQAEFYYVGSSLRGKLYHESQGDVERLERIIAEARAVFAGMGELDGDMKAVKRILDQP